MQYENISIDDKGFYAVITINRPKVLNALSSAVLSELATAVSELELSDDIRVVALTGAGDKSFVAGADIAEMSEMEPPHAQALAEMGGKLGEAMELSAKPYIAAVNGFALGGGCELALACDFIYATPNARFGQPEVKLGVIPGFGGTQRLLRRVGVAKARELVFSGDTIDADEALRIGLVDRLCEPGALLAEVEAMAGRIAKNGPLAVAEAKKLMHMGQSIPLDAAVMLEQRSFAGLFATADQKEGMAAFSQKRAPQFRGR